MNTQRGKHKVVNMEPQPVLHSDPERTLSSTMFKCPVCGLCGMVKNNTTAQPVCDGDDSGFLLDKEQVIEHLKNSLLGDCPKEVDVEKIHSNTIAAMKIALEEAGIKCAEDDVLTAFQNLVLSKNESRQPYTSAERDALVFAGMDTEEGIKRTEDALNFKGLESLLGSIEQFECNSAFPQKPKELE